jgi:hypothetical protein
VGLFRLSEIHGFSVNNSPISRAQVFSPSPLFQVPSDAKDGRDRRSLLSSMKRFPGQKFLSSRPLQLQSLQLLSRVRRSFVIVAASLMMWFGAAGIKTLPSHASTAAAVAAVAPQSKSILSASLEQIVDRYVEDHMFDDDVYDPVESVYREAIGDKIKGTHPKALSEITSSVLGQDGMKVEETSSSSGIGDWLMTAVTFLQRKGISESTAIILLTGSFVVAGPVVFLLGGMMVGSQSKRQIQRVFKKRYGDTYT